MFYILLCIYHLNKPNMFFFSYIKKLFYIYYKNNCQNILNCQKLSLHLRMQMRQRYESTTNT